MGKVADSALKRILSLGGAKCELRVRSIHSAYDSGNKAEVEISLHNVGTTSTWVHLSGKSTIYVGSASLITHSYRLRSIEPSFSGGRFGGRRNLVARGGGSYANVASIVCVCDNVRKILDHSMKNEVSFVVK